MKEAKVYEKIFQEYVIEAKCPHCKEKQSLCALEEEIDSAGTVEYKCNKCKEKFFVTIMTSFENCQHACGIADDCTELENCPSRNLCGILQVKNK